MSDNVLLHKARAPKNVWNTSVSNFFQHVTLIRERRRDQQRSNKRHPDETNISLFKGVRPNVVQSIRAFKGVELIAEANRLGQHFLYADCSAAETKAEVFSIIAASFSIPKPFGKSYDTLRNTLTEVVAQAGTQPGFVIMLEELPATHKFDKEARETLLDVFRDAAEFWAARKINFRVFYSFSLKSCLPDAPIKAVRRRRTK